MQQGFLGLASLAGRGGGFSAHGGVGANRTGFGNGSDVVEGHVFGLHRIKQSGIGNEKSPLRQDRRGLSGVLAASSGAQTLGTTLPSRVGQAFESFEEWGRETHDDEVWGAVPMKSRFHELEGCVRIGVPSVTTRTSHSSSLSKARGKERAMTTSAQSPRSPLPESTPARLVVIGGGFAGFWAAVAARRVAGPGARITLVSPEPALVIRPRLYEAKPETLAVPLLPLLSKINVSYVPGEAVRLDAAARSVTLANGDRVPYDRLVVATGSRMRRPPVPGAEQAFSVDTQAEAIAFDQRLSEIARDVAEPTIAVVGAGFAGIELTLELRDRLRAHAENRAAERLRIVLIDRAETVGPELGPGPRPVIEEALAAARVELRLGAGVQSLAKDRVTFDDGSEVIADAVVLSTGMAASPFTAQVPGERDRLDRIVVDSALRAPAAPEVFVAGDSAAADTGDGHRTLQSCQHAGQLGRVAGENAARDVHGLPLMPYSQLRYITCLDLGRSGAVITQGWERQIEKTGAAGKAFKRWVNTQLIYPPAEGTPDALLASSSTDLAERIELLGSRRADSGPA
jgi:NADH dehydrogenase